MDIINKVSPYLQQKITKQNVIALEALRLELAIALVDKAQELAERRKQMLWPKGEEKMTEMDRKIRLDADTAQIERDYNLLARVEAIVSERIALAIRLL
jgi:hypothetical protein